MQNPQELIQIETASMATNNGLEYMFQVVINQQDTPAISLDGLRELRRLCEYYGTLRLHDPPRRGEPQDQDELSI